MGKTIYLTDKEIDFLSRALDGLIQEENHADAETCENILSKIES